MRRLAPLALGALILLLTSPLAAATHPVQDKTLAELIAEGAPVALHIQHEYESAGNYHHKETRGDHTTTHSYEWGAKTAWEGTFFLQNRDGRLSGGGEVSRSGSAHLHDRIEHRGKDDGGEPYHKGTDVSCAYSVAEGNDVQPPWERARATLVGLEGEVVDGGKTLRLSSPQLGGLGLRDMDGCTYTGVGDDAAIEVELTYPENLRGSTLDKDLDGSPMDWSVDIPLDRFESRASQRHEWPLPREGEHHSTRFCQDAPADQGGEHGRGECRAGSTAVIRLFPSPCAELRASLSYHLGELRALGPPRDDAPEAYVVLSWGAEMRRIVGSVLDDARNLELLCPGETYDDPFPALVQAEEWYAQALIRLIEKGDYEERTVRELLGSERSRELMGDGDSDLMPRLEAALERDGHTSYGRPPAASPGQGKLSVSVHSPVSIHAWTEDGRHVGWDTTKGAPDITIEGATYEGAPMGFQRITLPPGFYRIGVDGLDQGTYLLNVTWQRGEGLADEGESFPLRSTQGRTLATHYALEPMPGNETLRLEKFPIHRLATSDAPGFVTEGAPSPAGNSAPQGGGQGAGGADAKSTPGPGAPLLALALVAGARLARRARR